MNIIREKLDQKQKEFLDFIDSFIVYNKLVNDYSIIYETEEYKDHYVLRIKFLNIQVPSNKFRIIMYKENQNLIGKFIIYINKNWAFDAFIMRKTLLKNSFKYKRNGRNGQGHNYVIELNDFKQVKELLEIFSKQLPKQ